MSRNMYNIDPVFASMTDDEKASFVIYLTNRLWIHMNIESAYDIVDNATIFAMAEGERLATLYAGR